MKLPKNNKPARVGPEKGYGPRHAFNAQEGDEAVPEPDNFGPGWQLKRALHSAQQKIPGAAQWFLNEVRSGILSDEDIEEIKKNPVSPQSMMALANAAIMLNPEFAGRSPGKLPGIPKMPKPGLKLHDPAPRYEGPGEPPMGEGKYSHLYEPGVEEELKLQAEYEKKAAQKDKPPDKTFPSLNKPPYDALKEPPPKNHMPYVSNTEWAAMTPEQQIAWAKEHAKFMDINKMNMEEPGPDTPAQKNAERLRQLKQAQSDYLESLKKGPHDEDQAAGWKHYIEEELGGTLPKDWGNINDLEGPIPPTTKELQAKHQEWLDAQGVDFGVGGGGELRGPLGPLEPDIILPYEPPIDPWEPGTPRFKKGKSKVRKIGVEKGYGPRHAANAKEGDLTKINTDTVPAMLTPREAVLNRNAAELAGRDKIEALNQQGNELARKGVDLAATGESDVPDPKAGERKLAGTGAASYLTRQLLEKFSGSPTAWELVPDFVKVLEREVDPTMAAKGLENVPEEASPGWEMFDKLRHLLDPSYDTVGKVKEAYGDLKHLLKQFTPGRDEPEIPSLSKQVIEPHEPAKDRSQSYPRREKGERQSGWDDYMKFLETAPPDEPGMFSEDTRTFLESLRQQPLEPDLDRMVIDPYHQPRPFQPKRDPLEEEDAYFEKGTKQVKPNNSKQQKPKSGSPYAQGYQKLQGGDDAVRRNPFPNRGPGGVYPQVAGGQPGILGQPPEQIGGLGGGLGARDEFGRQFSQRNEQGVFGRGHGVPGAIGQPSPWGSGPFKSPMGIYNGPIPEVPQPGGWNPTGPMQGGPQPVKRPPSAPFYPPGQGLRMQEGENDILGSGESIYGKSAPINLSAPSGLGDLVKALQAEGQKQGLSASQIQGLMAAFKGFQGMGGGGYGSDASVASAVDVSGTSNYGLHGYSGGISEVGYPPVIAPNASFSYDRGGWTGAYDPRWEFPSYQGGTGNVPGFNGPGSNPGIPGFRRGENDFKPGGSGLVDIPPADMRPDPFGGRAAERPFFRDRNVFGPDLRMSWMGGGRLGFQPPPWAAGFSQGPTMIPTTLGNSGYPMAVPASSDWNRSGPHPHTPPKNKE